MTWIRDKHNTRRSYGVGWGLVMGWWVGGAMGWVGGAMGWVGASYGVGGG